MTDQPEAKPSEPIADYWDLHDAPKKEGFTKAENIIRIVQTVLGAAVAGFAISVVVAGHWWTMPPPPPPPPPTVNVAVVAKQVVDLLRTQMTTNEELSKYGITVDDGGLTLINADLNKYDGLATVYTRKGTHKFVSVTVWADPTGAMFYQMDGVSTSNLIEAAKAEEPGAWGN